MLKQNVYEGQDNMKSVLLNKIKNKEITVGVVGLGYVGLPLAVEKAKAGFKTIGISMYRRPRSTWSTPGTTISEM